MVPSTPLQIRPTAKPAARTRWARIWLALGLTMALALSGCAAPAEPRPAPAPTDDTPSDDEGALTEGPAGNVLDGLAGDEEQPLLPGGVEAGSEPADAPAGTLALGVVFDALDGTPIEGATVRATCAGATIAAVGASDESDGAGRFTIPDDDSWVACPTITYEIDAAGYHLAVPLGGPTPASDAVHLVRAAMQSDDTT